MESTHGSMGKWQDRSRLLALCVVRYPSALIGPSDVCSGLSLPQPFDGAEYTLLKGTTANSTHWTLVAKCSGCTGYQGNDGDETVVNGTGIVPFAWAQGTTAVTTPSNNASAFNVHQAFGKWNHDLNAARSPSFNAWVSSNLLSAPAAESSSAVVVTTTKPTTAAPVPATSSKASSTLVTSVVAPKPSSAATPGKIPASCSGAGSPVFQVNCSFSDHYSLPNKSLECKISRQY